MRMACLTPSCAVTTAVVTLLTLCKIVTSLECSPNQHDLNGLKCCTKCAPGVGVVTPCNQDNDTVCASCRRGEMFSPSDSHQEPCKPCQTCPQYSHVKRMCNQSHDTQCECDHHYYFDSLSNACRMCDNCVMGFGAKRKCDLQRNTVCAQCPEGTFSDVISYDACKVCTSCKSNQLTLRYCDSTHNTICIDMPPAPVESTLGVSTTEAVVAKEGKSTQDKLIPVYCAVLGLVILLLLIYVVVKQVQYRRNPPNNKKNISYLAVTDPAGGGGGGTANGPLEVNTTTSTSNPLQAAAAAPGMTNRNQGSDSGVSLEHDSRPINNNMRIKDVPAAKLKAVETMLHSALHWRGGWTSFARELGYNNAKISLFENKASQSGRMPAEILLAEWSKSENATVEVLVRMLKGCEREDIVSALYSSGGSSGGDSSRHPAFLQHQQQQHQQMVGGTSSNGHVHPVGLASRPVIGGVSYGNLATQGQHLQGHLQGHPMGGQGQSSVIGGGGGGGQGHSTSVSGSSTTDISGGRYCGSSGVGPTTMGGGTTAFQHVVPSYHSLQGGQQQMV